MVFLFLNRAFIKAIYRTLITFIVIAIAMMIISKTNKVSIIFQAFCYVVIVVDACYVVIVVVLMTWTALLE